VSGAFSSASNTPDMILLFQRIHARLLNYNFADDWNDMCSSTPVKFKGLSFDGPMICQNYVCFYFPLFRFQVPDDSSRETTGYLAFGLLKMKHVAKALFSLHS
jgi:hypothetical protein